MWIEDYKSHSKQHSITTMAVTMGQMTNSRANITLMPLSYIPPGVVMATSVASAVSNVSLPPVNYSGSNIVYNQPLRHPHPLPPSTLANARPPPLLPHMQPGCYVHTAGNHYMTSTGVYTHPWGASPLLTTPRSRSQKLPIHHHPLLPLPHHNTLLLKYPHGTFPQQPYPYPYSIPPVQQYPLPVRPVLQHGIQQLSSVQPSNISKSTWHIA